MFLAILAAIPAIAAIFGVFKYWTQITVWLFKKTPEQKNEQIAADVQAKEDLVEKTGRPQ
jgi:hypothetical protein